MLVTKLGLRNVRRHGKWEGEEGDEKEQEELGRSHHGGGSPGPPAGRLINCSRSRRSPPCGAAAPAPRSPGSSCQEDTLERAGKRPRALSPAERPGAARVSPPPNAKVRAFIKPAPSSPLGPPLTGGRLLRRPGLDSRGRGVPFLTSSGPTTPEAAAMGRGCKLRNGKQGLGFRPQEIVFSALVVSGCHSHSKTETVRYVFWGTAVLCRKVWPRVLPQAKRGGAPPLGWGLPWLFCPNSLFSRPTPLMHCVGPKCPSVHGFWPFPSKYEN